MLHRGKTAFSNVSDAGGDESDDNDKNGDMLGVLCACSGSNDNDGDKSQTIWNIYDGYLSGGGSKSCDGELRN